MKLEDLCGESKPEPFTLERFLEGWEILKKKLAEPPSPPIRIVSYKRYKMAEEALADGASPREVEWILAGVSREVAKQMADGK